MLLSTSINLGFSVLGKLKPPDKTKQALRLDQRIGRAAQTLPACGFSRIAMLAERHTLRWIERLCGERKGNED